MQDPYRPHGPGPDPELARLAAQGQQRRMAMAQEHRAELSAAGKGHLATAVGAYRGSTLKRIMLAAILACLASGATGVTLTSLGYGEFGSYLIPGFVLAFITFMIWVFVPPLASQGAIAAEQAWSMSLPFQLNGYFPLLSAQPLYSRIVHWEIRWQDGARPPDRNLLQSVFCAVDPQASVEKADFTSASIASGPVSGQTGIRVNRVPVYRNHRVPAHVHAVIERVLLTLHRSHPIAQVTLR